MEKIDLSTVDAGELPVMNRLAILENKLLVWRNTLYDALLDAQISRSLEDERTEKTAKERAKRAQATINALEDALGKLKNETGA